MVQRSMGIRSRLVGVCAALALMIATGGASAQSPMPATGAPGSPGPLTIPMPSGQPDLTIPDPATLTQDDVAKAYTDLIHQMRQQAGLIDVLGPTGEDIYSQIDAAQADFMRRYNEELVQQLGQVGDVASIAGPMPPVGRLSDEIGGGTYAFFGAWMAAGFAQLDGGLLRESGQMPSKTDTISADKNGYRTSIELTSDLSYSFDGNQLVATSTVSYTTTMTDLATGKSFAQPSGSDSVAIELTGCPDSSGLVVARVKSAHVEGSTAAGSSGSATFKSEMNVHIFVDDSATAVRQETATTSDIAMRGAYSASGVMSDDWDSSTGFTRSESRSGTSKSGSPEWAPDTSRPGQSSGSGDFRSVADPDAAVDLVRGALFVAAILPAVMSSRTIDSAEKYWRGGNCVEVAVLQGNGGDVEAGSETQIVAQPRHKIDKVDLAKPVVATFSGKAGAQPVGVAIPAPADFTYTAGEKDGDTGTLTLTSTSNRGIGTTSVLFKVPEKQTPTPPPPTPTPPPPPTPEPTPEPLTGLHGTITYHFEMESTSNPGNTRVLDMTMDLALRSMDGPIDDDTRVEDIGTSTFSATFREEHVCDGGNKQVKKGSGDGSISLSPHEQAYVTSNFDDDGTIVLPRFDTSTFHIKDHPCPRSPAYDLDDSIGPYITACSPDGELLTGVTQGIRGVAEERDEVLGFSFDCTDTVKGDSGTTTVTVSGFLAGTNDIPAP